MGCHSPSSWKNSNCDSYEETSNQTNFNLEQTNTHPIDLITRSAEDETGTTPEMESDILAQSSYEIANSSSSPSSGSESVGSDDSNLNTGNLIINYIPPSITEYELRGLFEKVGPVDNVKIVRKKPEGHSLGYAFIKYRSPGDASGAICRLNGYRLQNKVLKVSMARPSSPDIKDANLYISGIPKHLTQTHLRVTFSNFGTIVNCKIIADSNGQSKGIGFVRYNTKVEALRAVQYLNKHHFPGSSVPLQVKLAEKPSHRNVKCGMYDSMNKLLATYKLDPIHRFDPSISSILKQYFPVIAEECTEYEGPNSETPIPNDSVCLYVYNLPAETDKAFLYSLFEEFGEIISVRPMVHYPTNQCKGFGFVNMRHFSSAHLAIQSLHGKVIRGKPLQVSLKK